MMSLGSVGIIGLSPVCGYCWHQVGGTVEQLEGGAGRGGDLVIWGFFLKFLQPSTGVVTPEFWPTTPVEGWLF